MVISALVLVMLAALFFGSLLVAIVVAVNAKTTGGRATAIVIGCLIFFGVPTLLLLMSLMAYRTTSQPRPAVVSRSSIEQDRGGTYDVEIVPQQIPKTGLPALPVVPPPAFVPAEATNGPELAAAGEWNTSVTHAFDANVYPSYLSAASCLVAKLPEAVKDRRLLSANEKGKIVPERIMLTGVGSKVEPLIPAIGRSLGELFEGTQIETPGRAEREPRDEILTIHFETEGGQAILSPWDREQSVENANLLCTVKSAERDISLRAFVSEKPWVESFDRFVSLNPKRDFVVGYSGDLRSSESDARTAALADATRKATRTFGGTAYSVVDGRHVVDRFAQRLSRPYGNVWREAVLLEVPSQNQVEVASVAVAERMDVIARIQMNKYFGILVLAIATVCLCVLLNWLTEGYYRGRVVLGLAALAVVGCLVVVLFVS